MNAPTLWFQKTLRLPPFRRGFHLVTHHLLDGFAELRSIRVGLLHVFLQHTSASISINENADPDVRRDLEMAMSRIVSAKLPYIHTLEGPDDMPAHVKSSLIGASVSVPIASGELCLGTWQGIYLCEHRDRASGRSLVLTACGCGNEPS